MNICERAVVMSETEVIDLPDLPKDVARHTPEDPAFAEQWPKGMTLKQILKSVEREVLLKALEKYKNQSEMAAALGVSQPTIARRLKKYGIKAMDLQNR
jgi:TyrR family helix-turn-helix protein